MRPHWWICKDGVIHDPMGDEYLNEPGFDRIEEHRDENEFRSILPRYDYLKLTK